MLKVQALTRRRGTCVVMWAVGTLVTGEIFVVLSNEGWGGSAALLPALTSYFVLDLDQSPHMTNVLLSPLQQNRETSAWACLEN